MSKLSKIKKTGKPISWTLNTIGVANRLKPFPHKETSEVYIQNQIKDAEGNILEIQDILLDSVLGEEIFYAVVGELIGRTPTKQEEANEMQAALQVVRGRARSTPPRLPSDPVSDVRMAVTKGEKGKPEAPAWEIIVQRSGSPNLEVFIDENGEPYAMLSDGRILPLTNTVVKAILYKFLKKALNRTPTTAEMNGYTLELIGNAADVTQADEDKQESLMNRDSAIVSVMIWLCKNNGKSLVGSMDAEIRSKLEEICHDYEMESEKWPLANHLTTYFKDRKQLMAKLNVRRTQRNLGKKREHTFEWIDPNRIPDWVLELVTNPGSKPATKTSPVTQGDAKNEGVASPASGPTPANKEVELPTPGDKVVEKPFPGSQGVEKEQESSKASTTDAKSTKPVKSSK